MISSSKRWPPRQVPAPEGTPMAPTHGRFIPREELAGFAAWMPAPVDSAPVHSRFGRRPEPAIAPPPEIALPTPAEPEVPAIDVEALQQAARQAGYHDGYRDGLAALENFKRSYAQQMTAQIGGFLEALQAQTQALDEPMAHSLMAAAMGLARQIVRAELQTHPALIAEVAKDTVAAITGAAQRLELHVHPDDRPLVEQGAGELLSRRAVTLVDDGHLTRGGCVLRSEVGQVDAQVETRWAQATQRLGLAAEPATDTASASADALEF